MKLLLLLFLATFTDEPKRLTVDEFVEKFPDAPRPVAKLTVREKREWMTHTKWPIVKTDIEIEATLGGVNATHVALPHMRTIDATDTKGERRFFHGYHSWPASKLGPHADDLRSGQRVKLIVRLYRVDSGKPVNFTKAHRLKGFYSRVTCRSETGLACNYAVRIIRVEPIPESPIDDDEPGTFGTGKPGTLGGIK